MEVMKKPAAMTTAKELEQEQEELETVRTPEKARRIFECLTPLGNS